MIDTVRIYIYGYFGGLVLFVLTLLIPQLAVVYMGLYFLAGLSFIFTTVQPIDDPQSSTVTHFDRASRWNSYSYIIAGALVVAALLVSVLPIQPNFSTFVIWSLSAGGIYGLTRFYGSSLVTSIITDYLKNQVPELQENAKPLVKKLQVDLDITSEELVTQFKIPRETADRTLHLFKQYVKNNLLAGDTFEDHEEE